MRSLGTAIAALALGFLSCAHNARLLPQAAQLDFFVESPREDPWNAKIRNWQTRNQLDRQTAAQRPVGSELHSAYGEFENELRRKVAAEMVAWIQSESRQHYIPDGETDHWATLSEVFAANGDDCDGLDLMQFVLLRKLGFSKDEIFRSIVVDRETGQHHMVTLWFEGGERVDPWVLDPTGVVTSELVRLSAVPKWSPIEIFDEARHFRVEEAPSAGAVAQR